MKNRLDHIGLACATLVALSACGGGSSDNNTPAMAQPTTTNVDATVIDGAIKNALVCIDKNGNGQCDAGETQGTTDAAGKVTLAVPNADVGKYPILALVGTNAVDADNGPVTTAYTLSAPADQVAVVSPLSTLVQQAVASSGATTAQAAKSVQDATGLTASPFADFTKAAAPTDGSVNPSTMARMIVLTTQQQAAVIASALGTSAADGSKITQADLDKAIQKKLLELLPALATALSEPAVVNASAAEKNAALLAAATNLVSTSGLSAAAMATVVAINTQNANPPAVVTAAPAPGLSLDTLNFTDAANYFVRTLGASTAQNTPDANNLTRFVERRTRVNNGQVARWGSGSDPARNADLSWNGTAWVACPINTENTSTPRDAQGNGQYTYCGRETGKTQRATFDIAGKSMADVYASVVAAGYTNLRIANPAALGAAVFPADSKLFYQTITPLTEAVSYYPSGANSPAGFGNIVTQYSAAIAAGGTAAAQPQGVGCNSPDTNGSGANSTTLEGMMAAKMGTPCIYAQGSITYNGVTYQSDATNDWWGNSTVNLGTVGTVSITTNASSTGFYTGNTLLRAAFTGAGANAVTYYACKQRYVNGSVRNCVVVGTGSYTVTTLGDGRALSFNNLPLQTAPLNYNRVLVERGGFVYLGYQSKPTVTNRARMNLMASTALLTQLGVPADDPSVPLTLANGSYQGTWDVRDSAAAVSPTTGTTLFINGNGTISCQNRSNNAFFPCTLFVTDAATGAFTYTDTTGTTASGTFDFMAGSATGTYIDPTSTPPNGSFVGGRR